MEGSQLENSKAFRLMSFVLHSQCGKTIKYRKVFVLLLPVTMCNTY